MFNCVDFVECVTIVVLVKHVELVERVELLAPGALFEYFQLCEQVELVYMKSKVLPQWPTCNKPMITTTLSNTQTDICPNKQVGTNKATTTAPPNIIDDIANSVCISKKNG